LSLDLPRSRFQICPACAPLLQRQKQTLASVRLWPSVKFANDRSQKACVAAMGRQRQFVTIGCRHSASKLSRSSVGARERPLSPAPTFAAPLANVKFQGRIQPVNATDWLNISAGVW